MQENEIGDSQIENIAYNIYKDIKPYIQSNYDNYFNWILNYRVFSLNEGIIVIDCLYEYDICKYQGRKVL